MIARRLALVLVSLAALAGCTHWKPLPNPSTAALGFAGSDVQAGIFEVDITPPSYLGMFGHGPESRVSVGTQLRLRCQAFVIIGARPEPGKPAEAVALVPCDLSSPSLLLQREVARRVAEQGTPIGAERILLMATHTHMAPAHYFPAGNYNGPFSSRLTGFDPRVVEFLSTRIAHAIVEAYTHAQWAQLAWSQGPMSQRITRNRNPLPLMRDRDVPDWLLKRIAADPLHPEEGAVDPTLSVLRIERYDAKAKKYVPYGAFATVGMHPTAVPNTCDMYNSDVFGYATRYVEEKLGADAPGFVVGIANGIEGDVMPARNSAGQREARRIGHRLADEIIARHALATTLDRHAAVRVAYRELTLPNAATRDPEAPLCPEPELGSGSGGGASDHPTLLRAFPQITPGASKLHPGGCHGPKLSLLLPSGSTVAGRDFPKVAPLSVVEIGTHTIVTVPAELTTMTGVRLREAVADELAKPVEGDNVARSIVVVGLTNEYLQYVATPEEYELQLYEGASTLYGPNSAAFLRDHAACLAHWLRTNSDASCKLGQTSAVNEVGRKVLYVEPDDAERMSPAAPAGESIGELGELSEPVVELTRDGELQVSVQFSGPNNRLVQTRDDLWIALHQGTATGALLADDTGTAVVVRYEAAERDEDPWKASFVPELSTLPALCGQPLTFVVGSRHGKKTRSFTLSCSDLRSLTKEWP